MWSKTIGNDHTVIITNNYLRDCWWTDNQLWEKKQTNKNRFVKTNDDYEM